MDSGTNSIVKWNPYTKGYFENPYAHLKDCRIHNPIQEIYNNSFFIFRYEDVNAIIRNTDYHVHSLSDYFKVKEDYIFKNQVNACPYLSQSTSMWPMYLNGKKHKIIRKVITKAFHSFPVEELILESLNETNTIFKDSFEFDLIEYCGIFIFRIIKKIMNFPDDVSYEELKYFSNLLAKSQDINIPKQIYIEINDKINLYKKLQTDSMFNDILEIELKKKDLNLTKDEKYSIFLISFMAFFETSKDSLSLGLMEVMQSSELKNNILSFDSDKLKLVIEEIFRFTCPLQYTIRINTTELQLHDITIPSGSKLYLCLASANRDENVFDNPNEIVLDRVNNNHLSFGSGTHICLGSTIARIEMNICLQPMLQFLKDFSVDNVVWANQIFMRTVKSIMISKNNE